MSITNFKQQFLDQTFLVPGVSPEFTQDGGQVRLNTLYVTDNYATLTAAGYLNPYVAANGVVSQGSQSLGMVVLASDLWFVYFNGGTGCFQPSISASGVITLLPVFGSNMTAIVPMTLAQFTGMYAAPYLLVPAPGAGSLIIVNSMQINLIYGSAALTSGGVVAAQYDSTVHGAGTLATNSEAAADFFATANTVFNFVAASGNTTGALPSSACVNKGLYLSNQTGAFATGTGSKFVVTVDYHLVSAS